jgi:hypothetical protein
MRAVNREELAWELRRENFNRSPVLTFFYFASVKSSDRKLGFSVNPMSGVPRWRQTDPESSLFGQNADSKACKYDQKNDGGGGSKFVITLLRKEDKRQDDAQDRQQNE